MQLPNHDDIIHAIEHRREVRVRFHSKEDGGVALTRDCAPMDYAASRRAHDQTPRYHFWDFDSDSGKPHVLSLPATQIHSVEVLDSVFDPEAFVTWPTSWAVPRTTWGTVN
ncbi:hypothetical protein MicroSTF_12420 [Microbacterium sp. STF-2]|uniref:hypothetical protein n=1 Tax=Microbacterium sp. STF-2 TaxID=3031132 RepID=UPI002AFFB1FE|nr:hypothetical protein [Microbacterium sp. STF-2]MEA1263837.1 hypothetical protein [Microbacterium sp. STF-2]